MGARRQAFYANLGPSTYRFTVNVSDGRGIWTESSASANFEIMPTFVQVQDVFVPLRWRGVRYLGASLSSACPPIDLTVERQLAESRSSERARIARELHDTLLQGTQALFLKVHGATVIARRGESVHEALDEVFAAADNVMAEGRDRIQGLRFDGADAYAMALSLASLVSNWLVDVLLGFASRCKNAGVNGVGHCVAKRQIRPDGSCSRPAERIAPPARFHMRTLGPV